MSANVIDLNGPRGSWQFRCVSPSGAAASAMRPVTEWMEADVPGTVHTDLLAAGAIPDPYRGMNEKLVQWVDAQQWAYRREFTVSAAVLEEERIELVAQGLDTFARISINGRAAAATANMFIEHRLDIRRLLRPGTNLIEILFDSPTARTAELEARHGRLRVALEPPRVYARKAQYSFGWDWGPKLATSGIWRSISIEARSGPRLKHPFARVRSIGAKAAIVELSVDIENAPRRGLALRAATCTEGWTDMRTAPVRGRTASFRLRIPDPQVWWPNGYGDQPMYSARLDLLDGEEEIDSVGLTFALRTVRLVQEKDAQGRSFIVDVNGVRIFSKGADWIPSDNFIPRIPDSTYERLLTLARDAHMNMIRVWGGGIYEQDLFYTLCDRLGLMVWQDFMFACGEYPEEGWFLRQVEEEAASVVRRLRNHPSIVVWCGNNECEWLFCTQHPDSTPDDMTGARIFNAILPDACREFDGSRPYWRSSPFGAGFPNDESNGNHHQWTVWSAWTDYKEYENDTGRFVTEFGFQAPANRETFDEVLPPADRGIQSAAFEHHNKQVEGPERLIRFQAAHHIVSTDFDEFIYKCQLVQAEALKCAVEHWRRRKFGTAGALFWQLNDCWPVSSWAVIDSALRPKAAYYFAKKFFAPLLVSFKQAGESIEVHLTNDRLTAVSGSIALAMRGLTGRSRWSEDLPVRVLANSTRRVATIGPERLDSRRAAVEYLHARLTVGGGVVSENRFFFAEPKRLALPEACVSTSLTGVAAGVCRLSVSSDRFVKYVRLTLDGEEGAFDDNYFDLESGGRREIVLRTPAPIGQVTERLRLRWLG